MKTAEQYIIDNYGKKFLKSDHNSTFTLDCMDDFAQQQAIEFLEWALKNEYGFSTMVEKWVDNKNQLFYTANELYQLFLNHQSK